MGAIAAELTKIIDRDRICQWEDLPPEKCQQILAAVTPQTQPELLVSPQTPAELGQVMALAKRNRWRVLPTGGGSKLHWGGLADGANLVVSTQRLNRVIDYAVEEFTLTVEAGVKLADIQNLLAQNNQFLAIDPAYANQATIGGIVATGDGGSWRHRYNSVRDQLLGISFCRHDGELVKAGGRVVKNVAGYDLMKLLTGSYGTLGIATQVTFRLYPIPEASATLVLTGTADGIATAAQTILSSALTPTAIDLLSTGSIAALEVGDGLGLMVRFQSLPESVTEQCDRVVEVAQKLGLQHQNYRDDAETDLWQRSRILMESGDRETQMTGKMGVIPTEAVNILTLLDKLLPENAIGIIHAGSGLGRVQINGKDGQLYLDRVARLRSGCEKASGFLSILEAPVSVKPKLDIWGYSGNAIEIMKTIKNKFDPKNILNPDRFLV
ncbi:FAD-binding oxidoreductase [Oscillatoriales cyanobacterium LEGE 11467]|uniref:FAD-binding oxidoreductase n=1 Tax=Zarconia navalis LEGE 11467 TaxID=1828826 RepID=A0A928VXM7_9CYAN|nr:FAD-binding oxidoreductase [Zarconia navalis]MBE9039665.1 FAD-binding oxidoreductase [Zarconia navalis LEGE 11467]